ncbi:aminotransferase class I/II-fold pyridoxal phosphate-dependent enzyme [Thermodesulfobacteriota bacterium]
MNQLAEQLNRIIEKGNPYIFEMLSDIGKNLFFPKGILSQGAEAKEKAHKLNATIGIATEHKKTMHLPSVMAAIDGIPPKESITYAPSFGIPSLRKVWQEALYEKNPSLADKPISLPVVTCGVTHAVSIFGDVWINPGDVVILPDMMWGNYNMILNVRKGARISQYPVFSDKGRYNIGAFKEKVSQEAAEHDKICVLLNFPHNPTGYSITREEGAQLVEILAETAARGTNVVVACDDSYFGLYYEEETLKESVFAQLSDRHPRLLAVKLDGATKENFVWGLRVGFVTYGGKCEDDPAALYEALEKKSAGAVRGNISNASHLSQSIVLKSMLDAKYREEKDEKFTILKNRAKRVKEVLADPRYKEAFEAYPFNAGYFMCIRLKSVNAEDLRVHLLDKYGVGLISMGKENLRIAFSCLEEGEIPELFDIILQGAKELQA